jgi:hypothetical protein
MSSRTLVSNAMRQRLRRLVRPAFMGSLRRTTPLSPNWGFDRGSPVDRYYIEKFLQDHAHDIRGRVLEMKDSGYTERFGKRVVHCDVLDIDPANSRASMRADLANADHLASDQFDCFVLTQTLQFIFDTRSAIRHACRLVRSGGTLLVTVPAVSRIERSGGFQTDYWRFTVASCSLLFAEVLPSSHVTVRSYGNVLSSIAFLAGMAAEELSPRELDVHDQFFPLIVTIRATKP